MAKIAVRTVAAGAGWSVEDVICSHGPDDRPFEEQHDEVVVAIVTAGSFQYRASGAAAGREMMTPGSILLGNHGQSFECGHEHAAGDRCLAFRFTPEYFESIAADAGGPGARRAFGLVRLPPARELSLLVAQACAALQRSEEFSRPRGGRPSGWPSDGLKPVACNREGWEELGVRLAARAVQVDGGRAPSPEPVSAAALARVTETIRAIEKRPEATLSLSTLARPTGLSRFHFLRVFESLTGVTPHQYVMRARLRQAAMRLQLETSKIVDVALESGFGDVSNFNRAFRAEFGLSPRAYRRRPGV